MYLDDLLREIELEYDHAYLGAFDEPTIQKVLEAWKDAPESEPAWQNYRDDWPDALDAADTWQDEIQTWLLVRWEEYINEE